MLSVCGPSGVVYRADKTPFVQDGFRTCVTHQSEEGRCSSLDHSPSEPNCESSRFGNWTETNCLYSKNELIPNIHTQHISSCIANRNQTNLFFFCFSNSVNDGKYWLMQQANHWQVYLQYKAHFSHTSNLI